MLKLLIPIVCKAGAPEAARHAAFLFAEKCVAQVELIEVLARWEKGASGHSGRVRNYDGTRNA